MLVDEKMRVMHLIKIRMDSVTHEMHKDLRGSIFQGLRDYQAARKEWERVWRVIREFNEVSKLVSGLEATGAKGKCDKRFLKAVEGEIDLAQKRIKVNSCTLVPRRSIMFTRSGAEFILKFMLQD